MIIGELGLEQFTACPLQIFVRRAVRGYRCSHDQYVAALGLDLDLYPFDDIVDFTSPLQGLEGPVGEG